MYKKEFEIRWSDVDANGHLANSAYVNFMSHTRVGFLNQNGFSLKELVANGLGPVMFSEQIYYFKESFLGQARKYEDLTIAVLAETQEGETRVSQSPDSVKTLVKAGFHVVVQSGGTYRTFRKTS